MNKFTGAESARLLSVLTEAVEKLTLLSHLPYINDSDDNRADVALAQSALLHAFPPPSSASGLYDQQQPSATTVLSQLVQDVLLQATDGGKLDLMHDGGGDGGSVAFREAMALARSFCRVVRHDASAHAVLTTVDSHRGSSGGPAQSRNTSSSPNHTGHVIHTHKSTSTNHHRSGLVALSGYVAAVRDQAAGTLSTSVEQDEATRQMMGDMETRIREAENDYKQMTVDVRAQREMRDVDVRRNAHKIHALTIDELHDIEQGADQAATLIDQDAKQAEFSLLNGYEGNVTQCRDESDLLSVRCTKSKDEHHVQEDGHRKRKLKAAVEVSNQIEQYDHVLGALQAQIDAARAAMATEVAEVSRLSAVFHRLDENYRLPAADHARWDAEEKERLAKEAAFVKMVARIQASYRGYMARKALRERKKKGTKKKGTKKKAVTKKKKTKA
ncbi:hypothetical protein B5M09_004011 [Aphanomyces astaci]|uniref:Dynein regulatory complex protein 10 n=1 Tax=Aphanomyces astaci TaxID=112090 RepID=A0A3R7YKC0_APHAT|nr:hypothetical protein B5M09_004011 [Aphanomyces astaci]